MRYFSFGLLALGLFLGLSGCASMPILEQLAVAPKLSVAQFSMSEASFLKQNFKIRLKIDNPNVFSLPILGLDYELDIAGVNVAKGRNENKITIPAGGREYLDINVNTNLLKSLPGLSGVLMSGGKDMTYAVTGNVKTNNAFVGSIPFSKTGQFEFAF